MWSPAVLQNHYCLFSYEPNSMDVTSNTSLGPIESHGNFQTGNENTSVRTCIALYEREETLHPLYMKTFWLSGKI